MANPIVRRHFGRENPRNDITAEEAREVFSYNPETGILDFRAPIPWASQQQIAPTFRRGKNHRVLVRLSVTYQAHRLIWLLMTGEWPANEVDHINGDPADNRWANLREATRSQNSVNRPYKNRTGYRGVAERHGKFYARIMDGVGNRVTLGCFATAEDAHEAYRLAAEKMYGDFMHSAPRPRKGRLSTAD